MVSFFHTHFPVLLSFFFSNERFFMFLLVSQWWERDQQQVQPAQPRKLQEAHSCPKQRDAFNLLCSCIRSQIPSWRNGVSGWKSGCTTDGQFPCAHEDAQLLGHYDWAGLHTMLSVCFFDLLRAAQSTSSAPHSVSQKSRQNKSALYTNTMITDRAFCWSCTGDWILWFNSSFWGKCPKVLLLGIATYKQWRPR